MSKPEKPIFDSDKEKIVEKKKATKKRTKKKTTKKKSSEIKEATDILPESMIEYGAIEDGQRMSELYRVEWAVRYPQMTPYNYLKSVKLFTEGQAKSILTHLPAKDWYNFKVGLQDDMTAKVLNRHVDMISEMQDTYIKGGRLAYARAIEMLTNKGIPKLDKEGNPVLNKEGKQVVMPMRTVDLLNLTSAMKNCMEMYRKCMGFNDSEGMTQALERINLTQINIHEAKDPTVAIDPETGEEIIIEDGHSKATTLLEELSYDDIQALVKRARQLTADDDEEKNEI
jgi:hypothetical protein